MSLAPDRSPLRLHPEARRLFALLVEATTALGCPVFMTEGYRSPERQNALYAQGRTTPGPKVTNARAGESWHETGRAIDFAFQGKSPYAEGHPWKLVGQMAEHLGFEWGGRWVSRPDKPHLQLTDDLALAAALAEAKQRGMA